MKLILTIVASVSGVTTVRCRMLASVWFWPRVWAADDSTLLDFASWASVLASISWESGLPLPNGVDEMTLSCTIAVAVASPGFTAR